MHKENEDELPVIGTDSAISKIKSSLREKTSEVFTWLDSQEGKIISKTITSLASFAAGDPTGMVFPLILECADSSVRKRFLKHVPDLINRLEDKKSQINYEFLKNEKGQRLLKETLREIIKEEEEEKIEALKRFLVSTVIKQNVDELRTTKYHKLLVQMDSAHIQILGVMTEPQTAIKKIISEKPKQENNDQLFIPDDFNKYFLKMEESIFKSSVNDLKNWDLISHKNSSKEEYEIYTMQESYWGRYQVEANISSGRTHSKMLWEETFAEGRTYGKDEKIVLALSCLTVNFITNYGWDFVQRIKNTK